MPENTTSTNTTATIAVGSQKEEIPLIPDENEPSQIENIKTEQSVTITPTNTVEKANSTAETAVPKEATPDNNNASDSNTTASTNVTNHNSSQPSLISSSPTPLARPNNDKGTAVFSVEGYSDDENMWYKLETLYSDILFLIVNLLRREHLCSLQYIPQGSPTKRDTKLR